MLQQQFCKVLLAPFLLISTQLLFVPQVSAEDDDGPPVNTAPIATAVGPITTAYNTAVPITLEGADSDEGDTLAFSASSPSHGELTPLTGASGTLVTYTPDTDYSGPDGFSFTVSDGEDTSLPAAVSITVSEPIVPANAVPVASAVGPITTAYNAAVPITLEGTDNDEGDTLAFSASSPSHGSLTPLSGASGSLVTYTPNTDYSGSDSFSFTVSDGKDTSAPVTVSITVSPPANTPPTAAFTASPPSGDAPLIVTFTNSSEDSDGTIEAYQWDFGDGSSFSTEQNPTHTYAEANPNPYTVTLTVTDNGGLPDSASASVTVTAASPPPVAVASAPSEVAEATVVTLDGSKSTGEGSLTYEWTQDSADAAKVTLKQKPDDTSATFTAPKVGLASIDLRFTLKVTDSKGLNSQATVTVRVNNNPALNSIPVADAGPGISIEQGNEVTLLGENSSDADGDETIVNYTWSQHPEDPVRVTLVNDPATPNATFIAPAVVKDVAPNGVYILRFELVVTDEEGAKSDPAPVIVNVVLGEGRSLPVADAGPDQTVAPGATVQLDGSASQGQAGATTGSLDLIAYLWASENPEVVFSDPAIVNPTFTVPTTIPNGSQLVLTLQVINSDGLIDIDEVVISVGVNPPVVDAGEPRTVGKGSTVTLTGTASDNGRIESRLWTQVEGLPVELADPSSEDGKTTFVAPTFEGDAATLRFEFQATDNENLKSSDVIEITVKKEVEFTGSSGGGLGFWSLIGLGVLFRFKKSGVVNDKK